MYKRIAVGVALLAGVAASASAQISSNATVRAELTSTLAIAVTGVTDFGQVPNDGTVPSIDPRHPGPMQSAAKLAATVTPNAPLTLTFSATPLANTADPNATITFVPGLWLNLVDDLAGPDTGDISTWNGATVVTGGSAMYFWLGGSLEGTKNQKPGTYTGTFTLTLAYQ